jgi:hypothetical protein
MVLLRALLFIDASFRAGLGSNISMKVMHADSGVWPMWIQIPPLPPTRIVWQFSLSSLSLLICKMGIIIPLIPGVV